MHLVNFVKKEMKKKGYTHQVLSQKLGYKNPANVSLILTGRTSLPARKIKTLAKALDTTPEIVYRLYMKDVAFLVLRESGLEHT